MKRDAKPFINLPLCSTVIFVAPDWSPTLIVVGFTISSVVTVVALDNVAV